MRSRAILALTASLCLTAPVVAAESTYFRLTRPSAPSATQADGQASQAAAQAAVAALYARPFSAQSYWNVPVGDGATYEAVPGIASVPVGLSSWLVPDLISVPVFKAAATDRTWRLVYNPLVWQRLYEGRWKQAGNSPEVEAEILAGSVPGFPYGYHPYVSQSGSAFQLPNGTYNPQVNPADGTAFTFKGPADIHPNGNSDAWMPVFQPDGKVVETYGTIVLGSGTVVAMTYQVTDSALAGDGWQNGVTASMIPVYAGLIRGTDLQAGRIDHAIKLLAPPGLLKPEFTYPALSFDRGALTEDPPYSGSLPMGSRLALPVGVNAGTLGIKTAFGKMVADAASTYGMIVTDRGGAGMTLVAEAGVASAYGWSWDLQTDLSRIVAACLRVKVPEASYRKSK